MIATDEIRASERAADYERAACLAAVLASVDAGDEREIGGQSPTTFAAIWNAAIEAAADAIREREPK